LLIPMVGEEAVGAGLLRLATHTVVRLDSESERAWNQIPTYRLLLELSGEKKPRAKTPFSDMSMSPVGSVFSYVRRSSDLQEQIKNKKMRTGK
jgi:hypothetical protein